MTATLDATKVEAYGLETAPLSNYVTQSRKIASEYVIKYEGKKRRVYSGTDRKDMFVIVKGAETSLPQEIENMLTYGNPQYHDLKLVAQSVAVLV